MTTIEHRYFSISNYLFFALFQITFHLVENQRYWQNTTYRPQLLQCSYWSITLSRDTGA